MNKIKLTKAIDMLDALLGGPSSIYSGDQKKAKSLLEEARGTLAKATTSAELAEVESLLKKVIRIAGMDLPVHLR